jgi:hypothetical protein
LFEIKAREKSNRRHMVDIPRIKFSRNADIGQIGHFWQVPPANAPPLCSRCAFLLKAYHWNR